MDYYVYSSEAKGVSVEEACPLFGEEDLDEELKPVTFDPSDPYYEVNKEIFYKKVITFA